MFFSSTVKCVVHKDKKFVISNKFGYIFFLFGSFINATLLEKNRILKRFE